MQISRNLFEQPFSTASGRITQINCVRDYFYLIKSPHSYCRFLVVIVLIRGFLMPDNSHPTLPSSLSFSTLQDLMVTEF